MLKKSSSNIVIDSSDSSQYAWKRRPSEISGYQRALYLTTDDGDYIRVDYNIRERRVRLYMEIESEGGNAYYSVISNGKISIEKSVSSGRTFAFADKFRARAEIFSTVTNRDVFRLINRNYGISKSKPGKDVQTARQKELEETKKRYFKEEYYRSDDKSIKKDEVIIWRMGFVDIVDLIIGLILSVAVFFYFKYSLVAIGIVATFFGIIIGFVDMFIRGRSPIFSKVVFFLITGVVLYIYGYFF